MRTVWKYPLSIEDEQEVQVRVGSVFRCIAAQPAEAAGVSVHDGLTDVVVMYVETDLDLIGVETWRILIVGTGHRWQPNDDEALQYLGTAVTEKGQLVWHVYRVHVRPLPFTDEEVAANYETMLADAASEGEPG